MKRMMFLALVPFVACDMTETTDGSEGEDAGLLSDSGSETTDGDSVATGDSSAATTMGQTMAVVTTVPSGEGFGALATVSLDDWSIQDNLVVTASDNAVSVSDALVFQLDRFGTDTMKVFEPGNWVAPLWEKAFADLSNPWDAAVCGDEVFVALYDADHLAVYDLATGNQTGTVDLSAYADGDDVGPEASSLVVYDGSLYVGLNRLDRSAYWSDAGGMVVQVDCATRQSTDSWSVGGNTFISPWVGGNGVVVAAEAYDEDPGGIYTLDPTEGLRHVAAVEGQNVFSVGAYGNAAVALSLATDWSSYGIHCLDLGNESITSQTSTSSFLRNVQVNDRGEAWVSASGSWLDEEAPSGIFVYDVATCAELTTEPITLSMPVSDVAFL